MFDTSRSTSTDARRRVPPPSVAAGGNAEPALATAQSLPSPQGAVQGAAAAAGDGGPAGGGVNAALQGEAVATGAAARSNLPRYMQAGAAASAAATSSPVASGASAPALPTAGMPASQAGGATVRVTPAANGAVAAGAAPDAMATAAGGAANTAARPVPEATPGAVAGAAVAASPSTTAPVATVPAAMPTNANGGAAAMQAQVDPAAPRTSPPDAQAAGVDPQNPKPAKSAELKSAPTAVAPQAGKKPAGKAGETAGITPPGQQAGKDAVKGKEAVAAEPAGKKADPKADAKTKGAGPAEQANPEIAQEAAAGSAGAAGVEVAGSAGGAADGPGAAAAGGGGGGGAAAGGAAGGEGAEAAAESAPAGPDAGAAEAAQEKTEEKMAQAEPAAASEEAQAEAEPAAATAAGDGADGAAEPQAETAGGGDAAAGGESGASEADASGAESGGGGAAAPEAAEASKPAEAGKGASPAQTTPADPEALQREQASREASEEQGDTQRVAESDSESHVQAQAEQQADTGGGGAAETGELSSAEKGAGVADLGESVGGGGGEGGGGGGAGGGGGGGAAAVEDGPPPDTAAQDPAAGLGAAASLSPVQAGAALAGVGNAIDRTAGEEATALQDQIPQAEVGADGAPATCVQTDDGGEGGDAPAAVDAGASAETPQPEATPEAGPAPSESVVAPSVTAGEGGKVSEEDGAKVQGAVDEMPTTDPGLDVSSGAPPQVQLQGDADPAAVDQQKAELDHTAAQQQAQGAVDAAKPAGENAIRVTRPKEVIKGPTVADTGGGGGKGAAADAAAAEEGIGIIAREKKGPEVSAAMAQAQGEMAAKKGEHQAKVSEEKTKNDQEMARLKDDNLAQQEAEKAGARGEVAKARSDWTAEQGREIKTANDKAGKEVAKGNEQVTAEQTKADADASKHIEDGDKQAGEEKVRAEKEAVAKKAEAKKESGGVFGWLSSKVASFFSALKKGLTAIFDAAKKLVRTVIDAAKKLAVAVIEAARKAIVAVIKAVGAALILLGDVLLAAFPGLKKKWRRFIENRVKAAENAVNRLADALKKGITKLLDLLGKAFEFLLDAYKKAMFMVLDAAKAVVDGAIKFAKAVADLVGTFVVLIKDIASNPGGWISNLGAAVMDGVKNHLWKSFKAAVKGWFNDKLEEVLGVGVTIWNVLKKGGITMKEVGHMAFEALKAAIPSALIQLLIEKVVAMIVPAAGAVMAIIEGLQAAWGTVQRIVAALGKFVSFLKAVKAGGAGPQFAELLAAAAIVVIDFVANWLLKKLRGPASKVGSKVKAIAQKIMAKVKAAMKKVGGALKKVAKKIGGAVKKAKKKFGDWRARRKARKDAAANKKGSDPHKNKQNKDAKNREKLKKAVAAIEPALRSLMARGVSKPRLWLQVQAWRVRHLLTSLKVNQSGANFSLTAKVNPLETFGAGLVFSGAQLSTLIRQVVAEELLNHPTVSGMAGADPGSASLIDGPTATAGHAMSMRSNLSGHGVINFGQQFSYGQWSPYSANYQMPGLPGGLGVQEYRARMGAGGAAMDRVGIPGSSGAYPHLAQVALPGLMKDTGMSSAQLAQQMRQFQQGSMHLGNMSSQHLATLGATSHLIFGVESARNVGNLVTAPMTAQLVEGGHLSMQQALTARGPHPSLPLAGANAPLQSRGLEAHIAEQTKIQPRVGGQGTVADANVMAKREEALIMAWVTQVAGGAVAAGSEESIRMHVRTLVRDWYRLHSNTAKR